MPQGASTAHLLQPKLIAILREGYGWDTLRRDAVAGATVAVVALPLSMAMAVASGVPPQHGLFTAIVGGFIVSALGGSRFQIGGPAGAFIALISASVLQHGLPATLLAVMMSGALLIVLGALRIGALVRHIPHAVTVGFTAGIAITIAASQIKDFAGLTLARAEPASLLMKLELLAESLPSSSFASLALGVATCALIFAFRRWRPTWPGMLIAVALASVAAAALHLPVATIGARFGAMAHGLPMPGVPPMSWALVGVMAPTALSFALLGAVESLLSAKVADGMTGRAHRSNMELIAQGAANIASALFAGISVTGTIARTATNIRAGAKTPVSGMLHAVFLLAFMAIAAPLAGYIPLAALAGLLLVVCWTMAEKAEFARLLGAWPTALVLLATLGATLVLDLTAGIVLGCCVAAVLALLRRRVPEEGA